MCILQSSKVLMYEFHYDCIKSKYNSRLLFTETDSLMYEVKTEDVYKDFSNIKKCVTLIIIELSQNIMIVQTN